MRPLRGADQPATDDDAGSQHANLYGGDHERAKRDPGADDRCDTNRDDRARNECSVPDCRVPDCRIDNGHGR
jgi:hypothetical protein